MSVSLASIRREFDERMDVSKPRFVDERGLSGWDVRVIRTINADLRRAFSTCESVLPKIIAQIRADFRLPRKAFARAAGLSANGYTPMEKDRPEGSLTERVLYTMILNCWREKGIKEGVREQCLDLLAPPAGLYSFYDRLRYDFGAKRVEEIIPNFYDMLWQRRRVGSVPGCEEPLRLVNELYPEPKKPKGEAGRRNDLRARERRRMRLGQAEAAWQRDRTTQLQGRDIEEPLVVLVVSMEMKIARDTGQSFTVQSIRETFGLGTKHATALHQNQVVPWDAVASVAERLLTKERLGSFRREWGAMWNTEVQRKSFGKQYHLAMCEGSLTYADLGRFLGLRPPEERIEGYISPVRRQRYRSDGDVRYVVMQNGSTPKISIDALIALVGRDDRHVQALDEYYRKERERFYKRTASNCHGRGLAMRIGRERAGADMKDIARVLLPNDANAKALRQADLSLQHLERQENRSDVPYSFEDVFRVLDTISRAKVAAALERLENRDTIPEELLQWKSVRDMAASLIKARRGANFVSTMTRERDTEGLWLRSDLITAMAIGRFVPPLPRLRHMSSSVASIDRLPPEVVDDWYDSFPKFLRERRVAPVRHPLGRVLTTMITRIEGGDPVHFYKQRCADGHPSKNSQQLYALQRRRVVPDTAFVDATVRAAGFPRNSVQHTLAMGLCQDTLPCVLSSLQKAMRRDGIEPKPSTLVGLTCDEIDRVFAKVRKRTS